MTSEALKADFVFARSRTKISASVIGTTIFSRSLTRTMFSYCPLHCSA